MNAEETLRSNYWLIDKRKTKQRLHRLFWICLGLALLAAILAPAYSDYTPRARNSAVLAALGTARESIAERLSQQPTTPISPDDATRIASGIPLETGDQINGTPITIGYKTIKADGTLVAFSPQLRALYVLTPRVENQKVEWSCIISGPPKDIPAECRHPLPL